MTCIHLAKLWTFVIILIAVKHSGKINFIFNLLWNVGHVQIFCYHFTGCTKIFETSVGQTYPVRKTNVYLLDAQLRVLTTNIDSTTKTFPFPPINLNTKANVVIGRVRAEDSFDKSAIIEYYLVNVSYLLQDSYQPSTSNRPSKYITLQVFQYRKLIAGCFFGSTCETTRIETERKTLLSFFNKFQRI